jgi:integrase
MATYAKGNKFITKFMVAGERHVRMTDTQASGEAWELAARSALMLGKPIPEPEGKPVRSVGGTDAGTMRGVLRSAETLHWAHLKDPKGALNANTFVDWVGPAVSPSDALTTAKVEEFITDELVAKRGVGGSTVNRYLSAINTLVKFSGKKLQEKPELSHLWRKESAGRIRWFDDDEEKLLLQTWLLWSKNYERDFLMFLIDTGARPFSEGTHAPWKDFGNRKVTFWDTKNNKPRTVPLTTRAWDAVQRQRSRKGNLPGPFADIDKDSIEKLYVRTREHLPVLKDTVLYTARHTCCSRLVQRGADLMRVKEWMGHKNIQTTMRYAHLAPQHLMDVAHLLEARA